MKNLILYLPLLFLIACQPNNPSEQKAEPMPEKADMKMADPAIMSFFEEVNVVKMHLFSTTEAMPNSDDYPYTGKAITGDALNFLSEDLKPSELDGAYGCYHTENSDHFILRVPGQSGSNSLVLARWNSNDRKLYKIMDLASLDCSKGACEQQDAWLADLDDNRTMELIIRKQTLGKNAADTNESFMVLTDDGNGQFVKTDEKLASLAVKDNYVMQ